MEEKEDSMASPTGNYQYDLSVTVIANSASARFGSSHDFAKPLLETNLINMSFNASALLSEDGSFVETRESSVNHSESSGTNMIQFQGVMSAMYLNMKHSHMECFIEPYPCFGQATYHAMQGDPSLHTQASKGTMTATFYCTASCLFSPNFLLSFAQQPCQISLLGL